MWCAQGSILGPLLFLLHFNDFEEALKKCEVIMFADDTVIYYRSKVVSVIENALNEDLKTIAKYLKENDLIINLKKGKTESMLFGTTHKLKKASLHTVFEYVEINLTTAYKYLGSLLDCKLSMNENFNQTYKKASSRIRLLSAMKSNFNATTAALIYKTMVTPLILFNSIINRELTSSQLNKLESLDNRVRKINSKVEIPSTVNLIRLNACNIVHKSLNRNTCSHFQNYFEKLDHEKQTRNNKYMLRLPKIKLEMGRSAFSYMVASLYNKLPLHLRKLDSHLEFKKSIKNHSFLSNYCGERHLGYKVCIQGSSPPHVWRNSLSRRIILRWYYIVI